MNINPFRDSPFAILNNDAIRSILSAFDDIELIRFASLTKSADKLMKITDQKQIETKQLLQDVDNILFARDASVVSHHDEIDKSGKFGYVDATIDSVLIARILNAAQIYGLPKEEVFKGIVLNRRNLIKYLSVLIGNDDNVEKIKHLAQLPAEIFNDQVTTFDAAAEIIKDKNTILMYQLLLSESPPLSKQSEFMLIKGIMLSKKANNQSIALIAYLAAISGNAKVSAEVRLEYVQSCFAFMQVDFNQQTVDEFMRFITSFITNIDERDIPKEIIIEPSKLQLNLIELFKFCDNSFIKIVNIPGMDRLLFCNIIDMEVIRAIGYGDLCSIPDEYEFEVPQLLNIFINYPFIKYESFKSSTTKLNDLLALDQLLNLDLLNTIVTNYINFKATFMDVWTRYLDPLFIQMLDECVLSASTLRKLRDSCKISSVYNLFKKDNTIINKLAEIIERFDDPFIPEQFEDKFLKIQYKRYLLKCLEEFWLTKIVVNINKFEIFHHPLLKLLCIIKLSESSREESMDQFNRNQILNYLAIAKFFNAIGQRNVDKLLHNNFEELIYQSVFVRTSLPPDNRDEKWTKLFQGLTNVIWYKINRLIQNSGFLDSFAAMPDVNIITRLINKFSLEQLLELADITSKHQQLSKVSLLKALTHPELINYIDYCNYDGIIYFAADIFTKYFVYTNQISDQANPSIAARLPFFNNHAQLLSSTITESVNPSLTTNSDQNTGQTHKRPGSEDATLQPNKKLCERTTDNSALPTQADQNEKPTNKRLLDSDLNAEIIESTSIEDSRNNRIRSSLPTVSRKRQC